MVLPARIAIALLESTGRAESQETGIHLGYVAAIVLQFLQNVRLDRDPSIQVQAPTWSAMLTSTGPTVEVLRESVRDL